MKALKIFGLILLLLFAAAFYFAFAPTHGRSLGVSITPRGFQTNTARQVMPLYAISNNSPRTVLVIPGIERRPAPDMWIDMLSHTQQMLAAHSEILVALSNNSPERAVVMCQREPFFGDAAGIAKRMIHTYFYFRRETEIVFP
jgi:hypothetical protein